MDANGIWHDDPAAINHVIMGYFQDIFTTSNPTGIPNVAAGVRPISLCPVFFKLVTKAMTNRIQGVITSLVGVNQYASGPCKQIYDSAIVAYETLHVMKNKCIGKIGQMALKLDMSKAYGRLEWDYVEVVLCAMRFNDHWIRLIMDSIRSQIRSWLMANLHKPSICLVVSVRGAFVTYYFHSVCGRFVYVTLRS